MTVIFSGARTVAATARGIRKVLMAAAASASLRLRPVRGKADASTRFCRLRPSIGHRQCVWAVPLAIGVRGVGGTERDELI
jgi:hypothetical protein